MHVFVTLGLLQNHRASVFSSIKWEWNYQPKYCDKHEWHQKSKSRLILRLEYCLQGVSLNSAFILEDNLFGNLAMHHMVHKDQQKIATSFWGCSFLLSSHRKRWSPQRSADIPKKLSYPCLWFLSPVSELSSTQGQNSGLNHVWKQIQMWVLWIWVLSWGWDFQASALWVTWSWNALLRSMYKSQQHK